MEHPNLVPRGISVTQNGPMTRYARRWYTHKVLIGVAGGTLFNGWTFIWFRNWISGTTGAASIWILLPIMALGLYATYNVLAALLNISVIEVGNGSLTVRHGPIPWPGNRLIEFSRIHHLLFDSKSFYFDTGNLVVYRLYLIVDTDRRLMLVSTGTQKDQALYLFHAMQRHLRLGTSIKQ